MEHKKKKKKVRKHKNEEIPEIIQTLFQKRNANVNSEIFLYFGREIHYFYLKNKCYAPASEKKLIKNEMSTSKKWS